MNCRVVTFIVFIQCLNFTDSCIIKNKDLPCSCFGIFYYTLQCICSEPTTIDLSADEIGDKDLIQNIYIYGCTLNNVTANSFVDYSSAVYHMELNQCYINTLENTAFERFVELQTLIIRSKIRTVMDFPKLPQKDCKQYIDVTISNTTITYIASSELECVWSLDMSNNDFSKGYPDISNLHNLQHVVCRYCRLQFAPNHLPPNLITAIFENNNIKAVEGAHPLSKFKKIEILSFAQNEISDISDDAFYSIHTHTDDGENIKIDFRNNNVKFLKQSLFYYLAGNEVGSGKIDFDLRDNYIYCGCYMQWILSIRYDMPHINIIGKCHSPPRLKLREVNSLKVSDFENHDHCKVNNLFLPKMKYNEGFLTATIIVSSTLGLGLLIVAILYWKHYYKDRKEVYRRLRTAQSECLVEEDNM